MLVKIDNLWVWFLYQEFISIIWFPLRQFDYSPKFSEQQRIGRKNWKSPDIERFPLLESVYNSFIKTFILKYNIQIFCKKYIIHYSGAQYNWMPIWRSQSNIVGYDKNLTRNSIMTVSLLFQIYKNSLLIRIVCVYIVLYLLVQYVLLIAVYRSESLYTYFQNLKHCR